MFVDLIKNIINSTKFSKNSNFKKNLKQYLYITVANRDDLHLGEVDFKNQTFNRLFNLSQRQGEFATPIRAIGMIDNIISENIFEELFKDTIPITIDKSCATIDGSVHLEYSPKYKKVKTYTEYLDKAFIYPEIHL